MSKTKGTILGIIVAVAIFAITAAPWTFRAGALAWQKHSAHRIFAKLTPVEREMLNSIPTSITIPRNRTEELASFEYESTLVRVRPPQSHESKQVLTLVYPQFHVTFLPPFAMTSAEFDAQTASDNVRLDDIDAQSDLESLKKLLLLLSSKPAALSPHCFEQFDGADLKGSIVAKDETFIIARLYFPLIHAGCGIWFRNTDGVKITDVHDYLSLLQLDPKPAATQTSTISSAPSTLP